MSAKIEAQALYKICGKFCNFFKFDVIYDVIMRLQKTNPHEWKGHFLSILNWSRGIRGSSSRIPSRMILVHDQPYK